MNIKRVFYITLQLTWGLPQSMLGLFLFFCHFSSPHSLYRGSILTKWNHRGGISLGMFIFADSGAGADMSRLTLHEYGHTIQSLLLGPFYLLIIGIPSFLWASIPALKKKRNREGIPYNSFYTERSAESLAKWVTGTEFV